MIQFDIIDGLLVVAILSLIGTLFYFKTRIKNFFSNHIRIIKTPKNKGALDNAINNLRRLLVIFSLFYLIISIYSIFLVYLDAKLAPALFIYWLLASTFSNAICNLLLLVLILSSVYLYYTWIGYSTNSKLHAINFALFAYIGFLLLFVGLVMFSLPSLDNNSVDVNSTTVTEITFVVTNTSDPLNFTQIASFNFSNITEIKAENTSSFNNSTLYENAGLKRLSSGVFGNSLGIIGLALALIALGIASFDKIQTSRVEEEILLHLQNGQNPLKKYKTSLTSEQIYILGTVWIAITTILGLIISFTITILPSLWTLLMMVLGIIIEIVGLILLSYAYYKSKTPPIDPESYTFDEMIQKIKDESKLRKD